MMSQPRILTFNFHEPYLCLMAKTGLDFDIGVYEESSHARPWHTQYRPKPANLHPVPEAEWRDKLKTGKYDAAIAHNETNALDIAHAPCAKLLVCHNRRTFLNTTVTVDEGDPIAVFGRLLAKLASLFDFVFISETKRDDYGLPGRVILPGIDLEEFSGYTGEERCILRVGNMMTDRRLMFDVGFQEEICRGLPNRVVGSDPQIPEAKPAESFEELLGFYRRCRCMLHVSREGYEDGYNLAMLEAMACGMPVAALANPTSPITDGIDGFTSYDAAVLHERLRQLLDDADLARALGARARETVAKKFPIEAFTEKWRAAVFEAAEGKRDPVKWRPKPTPHRPKILLHYLTSPLTTGRYFEQAMRETYDVLTVGTRLPEEALRMWGFDQEPPPYPPHQVDVPHKTPYAEILEALPRGYRPDLYFWIDSGPRQVEPDIDTLDVPKVAYLIDSHVSPELRLEMARHFDCAFLAQKAQVVWLKEQGIGHVYWAPLACSPALHDVGDLERIHDMAYVGSFSAEEGPRRPRLFKAVQERFPNSKVGRFWPREMARIYAQAKIVVNACHNHDVNMRVFEAMASGALLITDEAEGLEDLFEDGTHLVIYRNDNEVLGLIEQYLEDADARRRIAAAGQRLVLHKHTYARRVREIMDQVEQALGANALRVPQKKAADYYQNPRREVIQHVPFKAQRVLDIGCGAGALGYALKEERGVQEVTGVEVVEDVGAKARDVLDHVLVGDIETMALPFADAYFDCIVCGDVLEHLVDPAAVLRKLGRVLGDDGVIVISVPNVRYHEVIAMLGSGAWTYMDAGILDSTHLRFFTRSTLAAMVEEAGFEVAELHPLNIYDAQRLPRNPDGSLSLGKITIHDLDDAEYEEFLVYQWVAMAVKPGLDRLAPAREALEANDNEAAFAHAVDAVGVDEFERRHIMAKALARMGDLQKAEQCYRDVLAMRAAPDVEGEYGILLIGMNRVGDAKAYLERALKAKPDHDRVQGAMGLACLAGERYEDAYGYLQGALQANFEHVSLLKPFVDVAGMLGRFEDAEPLVRDFAEFYPGNPDLACEHAAVLMALERFDAARERLDTILLLSPHHEEAALLMEKLNTVPDKKGNEL